MSKKICLSADQIKPLAMAVGECIVTEKITAQGLPVRFMYREAPIFPKDSGWRFLSGLESDEYMENAKNQGVHDVNLVANIDPAVIPHLSEPVGAAFERLSADEPFEPAGDWEPDED